MGLPYICVYSAVILEQSMGARNWVGIGPPGGIDSLESIPGLLKSLKFGLRRPKAVGALEGAEKELSSC